MSHSERNTENNYGHHISSPLFKYDSFSFFLCYPFSRATKNPQIKIGRLSSTAHHTVLQVQTLTIQNETEFTAHGSTTLLITQSL